MTEKREIPRVLALGFFDGVHRGHAALLERTAERAAALGGEAAVMTFDTHPDTLVRGVSVPLINSAPDRALLIRELFGIQRVEFFRFTRETMHMSWDAFLETLCRELGCVHFVVGYDFRFGWEGRGTAGMLEEWCARRGLGCDVIGQVSLEDIVVSSTYIRQLLSAGDMPRAARYMGHPHILTDVVRSGHRLGRRLRAPTVNMRFAPGVLTPPFGVYAARVRLPEGRFDAVTNIGVHPTAGAEERPVVETHILDYSGSLYGRTLTLELHSFLRPERRFSSMEELSAQIALDSAGARQILEDMP